MEKVDLRTGLKHLYKPSAKEVTVVDVPEMSFLMVDGEGDPNTYEWYGQAVEALYAVSYALKFMVKKGESGVDYAVMPLEGLWWGADEYEVVVDAERGVLLRCASRLGGADFDALEVEEIHFDERFGEDVFTSREPLSWRS